jgi:hypothetical protein
MQTQEEGVLVIYDENKNIVGIVHKGEDRKSVFYKLSQMDTDDFKSLLGGTYKAG